MALYSDKNVYGLENIHRKTNKNQDTSSSPNEFCSKVILASLKIHF